MSEDPSTQVRSTATLPEVNGRRIYVVLIVPILFAALPVIFRRRHAAVGAGVGGGLLVLFAILGSASIGGAYIPAAAFALLAAALARASRPAI